MPQIEVEDAILEFPDDMPREEIRAAITKYQQKKNQANNEVELKKYREDQAAGTGIATWENGKALVKGVGGVLSGFGDMAKAAAHDVLPWSNRIGPGNHSELAALAQKGIDQQATGAVEAYDQGNTGEALVRGSVGMVPIVGSGAVDMVDRAAGAVGSGDSRAISSMVGEGAAAAVLPKLAARFLPKLAAGKQAYGAAKLPMSGPEINAVPTVDPLTMGQRAAGKPGAGFVQGLETIARNAIGGKGAFEKTGELQRHAALTDTIEAQRNIHPSRVGPGREYALGTELQKATQVARRHAKKEAVGALKKGRPAAFLKRPIKPADIKAIQSFANKNIAEGEAAVAGGAPAGIASAENLRGAAELGSEEPVTVGDLLAAIKVQRKAAGALPGSGEASVAQGRIQGLMGEQKRGVKNAATPTQLKNYKAGNSTYREFKRDYNPSSQVGGLISETKGGPKVAPENVVNKALNMTVDNTRLLEKAIEGKDRKVPLEKLVENADQRRFDQVTPKQVLQRLKRRGVEKPIDKAYEAKSLDISGGKKALFDTRGPEMAQVLKHIEREQPGFWEMLTPDEKLRLQDAAQKNMRLDLDTAKQLDARGLDLVKLLTVKAASLPTAALGINQGFAKFMADTVGPKRRAKAFVKQFKKTKGGRTNIPVNQRDEEERP